MEIIPQRLKLYGEGGKLFGIMLVNFLLTIVTLGLYYPWARAKMLQYLYGETEFAGSRLQFHGTGEEMFKGFIKAIALLGSLFLISFLTQRSGSLALSVIGSLLYFFGILLLIPLAIHGGLRYRMSRTSWRGIHFGYRGNLTELFKIIVGGMVLTFLTLGIYSFWLSIHVRQYCIGNIRMGNCEMRYKGNGGEFLWLNVKGILLTIITLGIYSFWYVRDLNHYYINNLVLVQDGNEFSFKSSLTAGDIFVTGIVNYFLVVFTLGLGTPWAVLRQLRMTIDNVELQGAFNPETVFQTEEDYSNATGEDMLDMLDIGLDF
ncbi:MAG TPA: DUF898 family protein [Chitinophagales bacterium]|nr:DUF898 family protein [Chitinophagales bacterium]